jgi:hypothetical protein
MRGRKEKRRTERRDGKEYGGFEGRCVTVTEYNDRRTKEKRYDDRRRK